MKKSRGIQSDATMKGRWMMAVAIGLYLGLLSFLAIEGQFTFVTKTAIVPVLVVLAVVSGNGRRFIKDWLLFLSLLVLFDACRGYIFHLIKTLDLSVYMNYAIDLERLLLLGRIGPAWAQEAFGSPESLTFMDKLLTIFHGSHFLFFLLFGMVLWFWRRGVFRGYRVSLLLVMFLGILGYALVPTVPPWMAARDFHTIPEIRRAVTQVYNVGMPALQGALDNNPIAAMPSLHAAFPTLLTLIAFRTWGWRAVPVLVYLVVMLFSLVYGGEHYVVDELGGVLLAAGVFFIVFNLRVHTRAKILLRAARRDWAVPFVFGTPIRRSLFMSALVLFVAEGLAQVTLNDISDWQPSVRFAERELRGKSPLVHFVLGNIALNSHDLQDSQREFEQAVAIAPTPYHRRAAQLKLGRAAFDNGDYPAAIQAWGAIPIQELDIDTGLRLAHAHYRSGAADRGFLLMNLLEAQFPEDARVIFERVATGFQYGLISRSEIQVAIRSLRLRLDDERAREYADSLASILEGGKTIGALRRGGHVGRWMNLQPAPVVGVGYHLLWPTRLERLAGPGGPRQLIEANN